MGHIQTILFGNGFNRLSSDEYNWDNVLKFAFESETIVKNAPNTHLFECLLQDDKSCGKINAIEDARKTKIAKRLDELRIKARKTDNQTSLMLKELIDTQVRFYLTTNYDDTFDCTLLKNNYALSLQDNTEHIFSLHRRKTFVRREESDMEMVLWNIHGTMQSPKTMMLGYDHYIQSVGKVIDYLNNGGNMPSDKYLKNSYQVYKKENPDTFKKEYLPYILWRITNESTEQIKYWPDLFFLSDVHIIGFGMDLAESDIWWILDKRARFIKSQDQSRWKYRIDNKIYYYGNLDKDKEVLKCLLEKYGIIVISSENPINSKQYAEAYKTWIMKMKENINKRR